ncbi:MAG: DNRLRE domain-containing protein [Opitutaceae bacterium]|nr:DNRLRE domain-containing protein [Opitutaceae bacterium]
MKTKKTPKHLASLLALLASGLWLTVANAQTILDSGTMLLENGRNVTIGETTGIYQGTVTGIGGNLTGAAWDGSATYYRFGASFAANYNTTTLWRFNDSSGLGIGAIANTAGAETLVNSAELRLTSGQSATTGGIFYVAPIIDDWTQAPASGADAPLPAIDTSRAVSANIASFTSGTQFTFDVTSIVQAWISGELVNYGFAIYTLNIGTNKDSDPGSFVSQVHNEYRGNLGQRPQLFIDYTTYAIPEPATFVILFASAAIAFAALRRFRSRS